MNGIVANVMSANMWWQYYPEVMRAVLLLTARDVDYDMWTPGVDGKDGAGTVCGEDAEWFVQNCSSVYPSGAAKEYGLWWGSITQNDNSTRIFNVKVPTPLPSNRHLRIVVTWDGNPSNPAALTYPVLTDFGLYMQIPGGPSLSCDSWWSNIEIIDVPPWYLNAGQTYQFSVTHTLNRLPQSFQKFTYASVAWGWPKTSAN